ncbi:MAG TPA: PAS domain S-box protein, partial [Longimicrobiales bacterium]|nr:PAS domain S-box protein [Longimicrobiales bacterium]
MSLVSSHSTVPGASGPTDASRLQDALRATAGLREADAWAAVRRILESGAAALGLESAGVWVREEGEGGARLRAGWPATAEASAGSGSDAAGRAAPDGGDAVPASAGALEAPLELAGGETGVLRFERAAGGAPWSEAERLLAAALAERIVAVLERGARLEAERELQERERQVEEAEALAGLGSWEWDVPANVIRWSHEQLRLHGLDAATHPDTFEQFLARVHPDDRAFVVEECERLMATGVPFGFTYRIVRSDGRTRWLHARGRMTPGSDGALSRMVGTSHDITELRETEEALRASERRFRDVFDQFPVSIQVFAPDGRLVRVNPAYERLWGFGVDRLGEYNPLVDPQLESIREDLRRGFAGEPVTLPVVAYDGRRLGSESHGGAEWPRWMEAFVFPVRDEAGGIREVVIVHTDVTEQKRAEEALRKSEARFRAVFEQFPLSIQIFDPNGETVEVNQRWEELFDATIDEVRQFNPLTEPQLAEVGAFIRRGFLGETIDVPATLFEARTAGADGKGAGKREPRWIEAFICPVRYDAGEVREVMIVHRDVTDEKRAEVALRASEESYRTIFELAGDAIFVHDPETGAVLDANRKACELHGVTLDELRALGVGGVSAGDPAAKGLEARDLVRRAAAGEPQLFEWQGRYNPTQEPVWVEVSLQRVGILGATRVLAIVRNVTERKLAEQALQQAYAELERRVAERTEELAVANRALESEIAEHRTARAQLQQQTAELEALFQALPDVYLRIREDGVVVDHRFGSDEALYPIPDGFPPILAGARITEHMPPELGGLLQAGITGVRRSGQTATFEYPLPVRGEERYFETRVAPMPDDTVICVIRDITSRKLSQAALAQAKEEADRAREAAEHANRAKSEFLSRMSHELRTPMNSILGFAQLLGRVELPPQHARSVQHILKAGRHLLQLINEVLEIARIEAGRQNFSLEPVRIGTVLHEAMGLVRPLAAQLHVQVEEGSDTVIDAYVRADRQRLAQVLLNLLSNAIKYNRPGGRVRLTCALESEEFDALAAGAGA